MLTVQLDTTNCTKDSWRDAGCADMAVLYQRKVRRFGEKTLEIQKLGCENFTGLFVVLLSIPVEV